MKLTDLLVIYFSIGAPLGVYSYFQMRSETHQNGFPLKTIFTFFFWLPAAVRLLREKLNSPKTDKFKTQTENSSLAAEKSKIQAAQKRLEEYFQFENRGVSVFEIRETLERYAGLSIAVKNQDSRANDSANEFFEITKNKNAEIAAKCFERRNRRLLFFHQTSARKDFLRLVENLPAACADKPKFIGAASEFADLLEDTEARNAIEQIAVKYTFAAENFVEKSLEKDLWKPEMSEPQHARMISQLLNVQTPTPRLRKKV